MGGLKQVIDRYTELTGRPFMPPIYGLEMGFSDCFNFPPRNTTDAIQMAKDYVQQRMPLGWMIVNDNYGCGYTQLEDVGDALRSQNMQLGLWTSTGLPNIGWEVSQAGVRVYKLDGALTYPGYRAGLSYCDQAYGDMRDNSNARPFVWTIFGWAGTQRCGVAWMGDETGTWDYIQYQIPTYAASTLSGMAYTDGDVGGIRDPQDNPQVYTRDLQWKSMLPVLMSINSLFSSRQQFIARQPWAYGEPYTSINRQYLLLHERLMPYLYTYARIAHETGVGPVRPLVSR